MKRSLIALMVVALAVVAFWLGRRTSDVEARPSTSTASSTESAVFARGAIPRQALIQPTLPSRKPARGLAADLVSSDPRIRRAAVTEAARGEADPQVMLAASRDSEIDVARTAVASLNQLYADGKVGPKEMIALATDRSIPDRTRILAINGVGSVSSPEAATMLVKMLASGSEMERRSAAALLGNQDPEVAIPALTASLSDQDEYVRLQALDSLKLLSRGRDFGTDAGAWRAWWQSAH